jgi:hypothetical protein
MPEGYTQTNNTHQRKFSEKEVGCAFTLGQQRCCIPEWLCWWNKESRPNHAYRDHYYYSDQRNCTDDIPRLISVNNQRLV